jgi:hypothetical protein
MLSEVAEKGLEIGNIDISKKTLKKEYDKKQYKKNKDKIAENKKIYYQENRENIIKYKKKYRIDNKLFVNEQQRKFYEKHNDGILKMAKENYYKNHDEILLQKRGNLSIMNINKKSRHKTRMRVIEKLGGKCVKCGFDNWMALQIDHINGDGRKDKKYLDGYILNSSDDEIKNNFQLLCANCNSIKRHENNEFGITYWSERKGLGDLIINDYIKSDKYLNSNDGLVKLDINTDSIYNFSEYLRNRINQKELSIIVSVRDGAIYLEKGDA